MTSSEVMLTLPENAGSFNKAVVTKRKSESGATGKRVLVAGCSTNSDGRMSPIETTTVVVCTCTCK